MLRNWDKICYLLSHANAKDAIDFVFHSFSLKTDISWSKVPHFLPNKLSAANHLGSGPAEHVAVGSWGSSGSLGKAKQPLTGTWGVREGGVCLPDFLLKKLPSQRFLKPHLRAHRTVKMTQDSPNALYVFSLKAWSCNSFILSLIVSYCVSASKYGRRGKYSRKIKSSQKTPHNPNIPSSCRFVQEVLCRNHKKTIEFFQSFLLSLHDWHEPSEVVKRKKSLEW